jgi:hypothetical protein
MHGERPSLPQFVVRSSDVRACWPGVPVPAVGGCVAAAFCLVLVSIRSMGEHLR